MHHYEVRRARKVHTKNLRPQATSKALQVHLVANPNLGCFYPSSKKIRWKSEEHGKRGSIHYIYYFYDAQGILFMLFVCGNNEIDPHMEISAPNNEPLKISVNATCPESSKTLPLP